MDPFLIPIWIVCAFLLYALCWTIHRKCFKVSTEIRRNSAIFINYIQNRERRNASLIDIFDGNGVLEMIEEIGLEKKRIKEIEKQLGHQAIVVDDSQYHMITDEDSSLHISEPPGDDGSANQSA